MPLNISPIGIPQPIQPGAGATTRKPSDGFQQALETAIEQVDKSNGAANTSIRQFLNGENEDLHNTVLATQKAELHLDMFLQVRNKVVSAYQEIMKMQV